MISARTIAPILFIFATTAALGAKWDYDTPAERKSYEEFFLTLDEVRQRFVDHTAYPERDKNPALDASMISDTIAALRELAQNDIDVPEDRDFARRLEIVQTPFVDRIDRYQNFLTPRIREIIATDRGSKQYWILKTAIEKRILIAAQAMLGDAYPDTRRAYAQAQSDFEEAYASLIR